MSGQAACIAATARAGGEALADPAEVDGRAHLEPRPAGVAVELDCRARAPAVQTDGEARAQLLEGAVVAGRDQRRQDGGVIPAAGRVARVEGRGERGDQALVDVDPIADRPR